jgi:hypothetical protein
MKKVVVIIALFLSAFSFAQESYKYVIVPKRFSIFNEDNRFNLNTLTKSFFENQGFQVYFASDILPEELAKNRCLALFVDANEEKKFLAKSVNIEIKDCYNNVLFFSEYGTSKEKEFVKAYNEAFRIALNSLKGNLKFKNNFVKTPETSKEVVVKEPIAKPNTIIDVSQLRAVPTETGYNLINHTNNIVLILHSTSLENVFIASKDIFKGVLIKKNSGWFFEYDFDGKVYSEKIEVKF